MAIQGPIRTRHEDVFPEAVLVLSVEPIEDFDKRNAGVADPQDRDKDTGMRLWAVSILDPTARTGQREIKVKIPAEQQPVPPNGLLADVYFTDLAVVPWVDTNRARPRVAMSFRASGMSTGPTDTDTGNGDRGTTGDAPGQTSTGTASTGSTSTGTASTGSAGAAGSSPSGGNASGASGEGSARSSRGGAK